MADSEKNEMEAKDDVADAVLKNIDACKQLSAITRTSLFPKGMNKMVINHLDKLFVTNDTATVVNELEVLHPAAKIMVLAGKAQQEEIGGGANLTVSFAGELLQNAKELIRMGLNPSEIIIGYKKAINKTIEILEELVEKNSENMNVRDKDDVILRMRSSVASKQFGQEDKLCPLITEACIQVCPKNPTNFNADNVRVAKILGGGLHDSSVVRGMVLKSYAVGTIKRMEKAKVAVFAEGVDTAATETKGPVLVHNVEQLENYSKTEEAKVEELIKAVADLGAKVIVSGAAVGEMALHFCERYKLMVLKISSELELRRFCCTAGTVALLKLSQPAPDDLGYVDSISVEEIGGARVTIVKNEQGGNSVSTVVLRGSTDSILDDLERAVDDGVNAYKAMCRDSRIVPGAGATEIELAKKLKEFSVKEAGLDQCAITKFAESFEMVPKALAENAGLNAIEIITSLYAEHAAGNAKVGIDLEEGVCKDASAMNMWDLYIAKFFALKYAVDAALLVLQVDQVHGDDFPCDVELNPLPLKKCYANEWASLLRHIMWMVSKKDASTGKTQGVAKQSAAGPTGPTADELSSAGLSSSGSFSAKALDAELLAAACPSAAGPLVAWPSAAGPSAAGPCSFWDIYQQLQLEEATDQGGRTRQMDVRRLQRRWRMENLLDRQASLLSQEIQGELERKRRADWLKMQREQLEWEWQQEDGGGEREEKRAHKRRMCE